MIRVQCRVFSDKRSLIPEENKIYECRHCGGAIVVNKGTAVHESYTLDDRCELLIRGTKEKELILIHGFGNRANKDYSAWVGQCLKLGWEGNIRGYQWDTHIGLLNKMLALPLTVAEFIYEYRSSRSKAKKEGEQLARLIAHVLENKIEITLLGFSLGCRLILFALRKLGRWRYRDAVDVHLCAGAVPISESWKTGSVRNIFNYYSAGDRMLGILFKAGELGGKAIGSAGLRRGRAKHFTNIPALSENKKPIGHREYEKTFAQFGRL